MGLLTGLRVLDLTLRLPGPWCSLLLADHGADVILVAAPGLEGVYPMATDPPGLSCYERYLNRGKRSLALDLKAPAGREAFRRLAATADVVMEGFRPGVAARLGVDAATLRAEFPRLVHCSISGYGQRDPRSGLAGHDLDYAAWAGVLGLNGAAGGPPVPLPVQVGDLFGGAMAAATAILMALVARQRTGGGASLDVPMTDGTMAMLALPAAEHLGGGGPDPARGALTLSGAYPCYDVYPCGDGGFLAVGALEPVFWRRLVEALGRPDLLPGQYATGDEGRDVRAALVGVLAGRSRDAWMDVLGPADCCVAPVLSLAEALAHPLARARGMVAPVPSPLGGTEDQLAPPVLCDGARAVPAAPAPRPGQHTGEILESLGYDAEAIGALRRQEVIGP